MHEPAYHEKPVIFGAAAVALRQAGLAVLPAYGKQPMRRGFNIWRQAPSLRVVEKWAKANPNANIVYIPGLSTTKKNPYGLVVVDADSPAEYDLVEGIFGYTPAMIATRRGRHFIYRADGAALGKVGSLRQCGYQIDIKHGQSGSGISVAPPSRHPDQDDFAYSWYSNSGLESLADLPPFNSRALGELISRSKTLHYFTGRSEVLRNATQTAPPRASTVNATGLWSFRQGSRKLELNDHLCANAAFFDDLDDCLDFAMTWTNNQHDLNGITPLPDDEILAVCKTIMADVGEGKLPRTLGRRAIGISDADEVRTLASQFRNGDAAFMLLMLFRAEHTARCSRGETFAICIEAMVNAQTLGGWSARRYRDARNVLLALGLIEQVSEASGPEAAQYRLGNRRQTPSVALAKRRSREML